MKTKQTSGRRFIDAATMSLFSVLSSLLLIYVGFGEAQRTYQQFHIEKLTAQARVVQNAMNTFLRAGLPMTQFVGFKTLVEPILASDDSIAAMIAFDRSERPIFAAGDADIALLAKEPADAPTSDDPIDLRRTDAYLQAVLPLRNRFETVGSLAITMPRSVVTEHVTEKFRPRLVFAAILSIVFALIVSIAGPRLSRQRLPWLQIIYTLTFLVMAVVVIGTLVSLYTEGAQAKTKALADSLGQRLSDIVAFNLNIDAFEGLDSTFDEYRRLNPDISAVGLIVDGQVRIHTDPGAVGQPWKSDARTYEYVFDLAPADSPRKLNIAVALPTEIVYRQVARSVKNFAALFVASAFLAGLFLQLASSMKQSNSTEPPCGPGTTCPDKDEAALNLVKPVFFVAVFLEHLNYSFLPQFMQQAAASSGLSASFASMPFMVYYLCFALALIPAGRFAQHRGPRPLIYGGLVLAAIGLLAMASPIDFPLVTLARATSGVGQGMLFIGVQSYILAMAAPGKKTRGAAIIVFGFQGGMVSGMAIGSLLVGYMGAEGVFTLAGFIALAMAFYASVLVPRTAPHAGVDDGMGITLRQLGRDMGQVLRNVDFVMTMLLVGIPAKAVMTGIVIFALPLILTQMQFAQEDIGQIIMLYAAGVLVASTVISRRVDRTGKTDTILFWGTVMSGVGLMLIGVVAWEPINGQSQASAGEVLALIAGVIIVGVAHGFINAPVVTHIADSELATKIGASSATANYRFLERIGHIAGPIIVGQLLFLGGHDTTVIAWIGGIIIIFGLLFLVHAVPAHANGTSTAVNAIEREKLS